jgi:hypothetical protein
MNPITLVALRAFLDGRDHQLAPPPFDASIAEAVLGASGAPGTPHRALLELANGAFLFDGALHLFGACEAPPWHSLSAWNAPATWRDAYGDLAGGLVFFAEDAFGDQYAYSGIGGEVVLFEAELGRAVHAAPSFTAWIEALSTAAESLLPIELVRAHGRASPGKQLYAYPPLFSVEAKDGVSIGDVDAVEAMRARGQLARQIRDLPPGTQIKITVEE